MGISFSIPCDPCINKVFQWLDEKVVCIHNLEKNLTALDKTMAELKAKQDYLLRKVIVEEDRGLQRLAELQVWVTKIEIIEKETIDLLRTRHVELQRQCLCGFCSKSLTSSYRYGKRVLLALREVEKLERRGFEVVAEQPQIPEVQERQLQPIIVGQETMLDKAWKQLKDDGVGIMGMYGMGGVGKTTLLTQLNNKFREVRCGFDFVIWVVVSKELRVEKIQDEIGQKVRLGGVEWKQKEKSQKADVIYNFLRNKRFVLFLDDIWEKVDLAEIGVPFPTAENKCKVVFTTRSQDVCAYMGVQEPMQVKCLDDNDAFDLFQKKVGHITLGSDPEIPEVAKIVAKKCCGLPLALSVIGETMSCKRTIQEWHHAVDVLTSYAIEFSGMEDKIIPLLKYSYDNLKGEQLKLCFVYCALFPEDYRIPIKDLIDYWICEDIIDGSEGMERAENKGYEIIGSLVRASLLMVDVNARHGIDNVLMHDVVREMALWIASDLGRQKETFIVHAGVGLHDIPKVKNWNTVRKMSLMNNKILHLAGHPECLELTTLLMQKTNLEKISSEFFKFMPKLAVLNLSGNGKLSELPDEISELVSLQYLNLSNTSIRHLPRGVQGLKKLIRLDLKGTLNLSSIVGISNLHSLKVLKLDDSKFSWDIKIVEELETLEYLEVVTMRISQAPFLEKYLSSHRLTSCTRYLQIKHVESSGGISLPGTMEKLRDFHMVDSKISEIKVVSLLHNPKNPCFLSLSNLLILNCGFLRELTFLMFAPNLKDLDVRSANQLEDIINKEKACEFVNSGIVPFPKLTSLKLSSLPVLKYIHGSPLPLLRLENIRVIGCPKLRRLPLNSNSGLEGGKGLIIRYRENEWFESMEWEDEATKSRFLPLSVKMGF